MDGHILFDIPFDILNFYLIYFQQAHQIQINASTPNDLTEANVRNRLKLGDPADSSSTQKRLNSTSPAPSPTQPQATQSPVSPKSSSQEMEFGEAARQEPERR